MGSFLVRESTRGRVETLSAYTDSSKRVTDVTLLHIEITTCPDLIMVCVCVRLKVWL